MTKFRVKKILPLQSGTNARGEWKSQEIIVEDLADVQYPNQLLLRCTGDRTATVKGIQEGDLVDVGYAATVRAFNTHDGRCLYVQENRCWRMDRC